MLSVFSINFNYCRCATSRLRTKTPLISNKGAGPNFYFQMAGSSASSDTVSVANLPHIQLLQLKSIEHMLRFALNYLKRKVMATSTIPPYNPLIVVLGATGTGKSQVKPPSTPPSNSEVHSLTPSQLAIDLAMRFNGEIINGDAMQMYDGLPIITNKVTIKEQNGIPHHLLGFISLDEEPWRVGQFKAKASQIIREIRSRGRLPILVGGTHYYTQSLLFEGQLVPANQAEDGQTDVPNQEILLNKFPILMGPTEAMLEKLKEVDPIMACRWHPNDRTRIRRSLEIYLLTGKKASRIYNEQKENKALSPNVLNIPEDQGVISQIQSTLFFWVYSESKVLKSRLDGRVDKMMKAGLLNEVLSMDSYLESKSNAGIDVDQGRGIWVSIGWKEFDQYLVALKSHASPDELEQLLKLSVEQVQAATRQYAKRQISWIRNKLMKALADNNSLDRFFLMDGTNVGDWSSSVAEPACDITERFLAGGQLPLPTETSEAARLVLSNDELSEVTEKIVRTCETCCVTTISETQWKAHTQSRGHRARVKRNLRNSCGRPGIEQNQGLETP